MVLLTSARILIRRLATALALLAMLALGLHETAHAAGFFVEGGQPPVMTGQIHLHATPDHDRTDDGPGKHHGAAPHSCHVCGAVMPMPEPTMAVPVPAFAIPAPAPPAGHAGLDPGGPRRPPRALIIA